MIAGATAKGLKVVNGMSSSTTNELTKKALASASIGGAAVAVSGGEEREIIEAFVKGAALTFAREHYKKTTNKEIEGKAPTRSAVTKVDSEGKPILVDSSTKHQYSILIDKNGSPIRDARGNYQIDIRTMPSNISHVGIATDTPNASLFSGAETSKFMQTLAQISYFNDIAIFHDQWAAVVQMEGLEVQATILPVAILTVTGSDTPIINQATNTIIEQKKKPSEQNQ